MAEAYLNALAGDRFHAQSGGIEPGILNPQAIEVMKEVGIDISGNTTKSVFDFYRKGELFHYVIAVCDEATAEQCPIFPGHAKRLHWSFDDPSTFQGSYREKLEKTRAVRDQLKARIEQWMNSINGGKN
jgi:arsenate reductase